MSKLSRTFETGTNIAMILIFFMLLSAFLYKTYNGDPPKAPSVGERLPELAGYHWQASSHSLVLVLRKGCHFCEESMPFYRTLSSLEKDDRLNARIVTVFPDPAQEVGELLRAQNLTIPSISRIDASSLKVSGTPTLILVDQDGKVEKTWVGKLDGAGEDSVLAALRKVQAGMPSAKLPAAQ